MRKTVLWLTILLGMLVTLLPLYAAGTKEAAAPARQFLLRFNHVLAPGEPYHAAFQRWAEAVARRTNGNLRIEVFPSAQLGVEEDILEQIRLGANVGQNTDSARLGMFVPSIAVINAAYFLDSLEEVQRLSALPAVQQWKAELERTRGLKVLSMNWTQGFRQMLTHRPIRRPEDLSGLRIRTPGAPIWQESIRALGATPTALAFGEIYAGLQTRVVDGAELTFTNVVNLRLHEVARVMSETRHIMLVNFQTISTSWFNSLPVEYQRILQEECDAAGLEVSRKFMGGVLDEGNQEELIRRGMTIIPYEEIDIAAFRRGAERAYERLNLVAVRDQIYRELGKTR